MQSWPQGYGTPAPITSDYKGNKREENWWERKGRDHHVLEVETLDFNEAIRSFAD